VILIDVTPEPDGTGWNVQIEYPGASPQKARMVAGEDDTGRKWPLPDPARRPGSDDISWDRDPDDLSNLSKKITNRSVDATDAVAYGRHLFDTLLGQASWKLVEDAHDGDGPLILGLRWPADQGTLHRMVWELLHDGNDFLALRAKRPVVPIRIVLSVTPMPSTIQSLPKVLFAVGTDVTDRRVRAGAEFMGVLRGLERGGGAVHSKVLAKATEKQLRDTCERMKPDIVHVIAHGQWDSKSGITTLELRSDGGGSEEVTADVVARTVTGSGQHPPTAIIVSVCQSGNTNHDAGLPLAARLVEAGIPLVIAMAGDVADTPCRVFTRSVADAIGRGHPLTTAIADGRRAALLYTQSGATPETIDWALPALFASYPVPSDFRLVNAARIEDVRTRIVRFDLSRPPLFCGRDDSLEDLERLLDPTHPLAVLIASTERDGRFGGTRLLRELAGFAIRDRHLPIFIGPFKEGEAPNNLAMLADEIDRKLTYIAALHGIEPPHSLLASAAADFALKLGKNLAPGESFTQSCKNRFAQAVREDLNVLRDRIAAKNPAHVRDDATALLLFDDVHCYDDALELLLKSVGPTGLGVAPTKLPVVIFGKSTSGAGALLIDFQATAGGSGWARFHTLRHVTELADDLDRFTFLSWYLHPEPEVVGAPTSVLAPALSDEWIDTLRGYTKDKLCFYDPASLAEVERIGIKYGWLRKGNDDAILQAYGMRR